MRNTVSPFFSQGLRGINNKGMLVLWGQSVDVGSFKRNQLLVNNQGFACTSPDQMKNHLFFSWSVKKKFQRKHEHPNFSHAREKALRRVVHQTSDAHLCQPLLFAVHIVASGNGLSGVFLFLSWLLHLIQVELVYRSTARILGAQGLIVVPHS